MDQPENVETMVLPEPFFDSSQHRQNRSGWDDRLYRCIDDLNCSARESAATESKADTVFLKAGSRCQQSTGCFMKHFALASIWNKYQ
jgi:hypothetical protein